MALRAECRHRRSVRVGCGCGAQVGGRTWFLRNRATTLPSRREGTTRGGWPAAADVVFAKLRNDPPAGAGSSRRVRPAGRTTRGRTGAGRGGRGFCEIAQRPSRRGRLLSPGSPRAGARPGEGRAQVAADVVFAKLRNDPPAGAGSCRRVRPGRVTTRGKDGRRSWGTWFLRNRATTLPPGQAPAAGLASAGCAAVTTRGTTGAGRGGRGFCEIAQRPSRRAGSCRRTRRPGAPTPGERRAQVVGDVVFCEIAQRPSRRGRLPPPDSLRPGAPLSSPPRRTTGADRGGLGFCEIAQRPSRRGRRPPPDSLRLGAPPRSPPRGNDGRRSWGTWFFAKSRNDPPAGAGSRRRTRFGRVRRRGHRPGERRAEVGGT